VAGVRPQPPDTGHGVRPRLLKNTIAPGQVGEDLVGLGEVVLNIEVAGVEGQLEVDIRRGQASMPGEEVREVGNRGLRGMIP